MKILSMKVIAAWLAVLLLTVQCPALAEQAPVQSPEPGAVFSLGEGSHVLDAAALAAAAQVVVSPGAVAVIDFANQKDLDLTGAFVNQGAVYFGSSSALVTDVSLSAASILNEAGATISSLLPAGLPGFASAVASLSFTLSAVGDLVNRGSIVSSGNLNLTAGGALVNEGLVSARQSVNIAALAGTLTNSGTIAALAGNLNISALLPQFEAGSIARSLAVNNQSGLL